MTKPLSTEEKVARLVKRHCDRWASRWQEFPCWDVPLNKNRYGYYVRKRSIKESTFIHIRIFESIFFKVPDGYELDHLCRKTWCVNPFHLEPVTHKENIRRGVVKSKITFEKAEEIRRRYEIGGVTLTALGKEFSITKQAVSHIISFKTWHRKYMPEGEGKWNSTKSQ